MIKYFVYAGVMGWLAWGAVAPTFARMIVAPL